LISSKIILLLLSGCENTQLGMSGRENAPLTYGAEIVLSSLKIICGMGDREDALLTLADEFCRPQITGWRQSAPIGPELGGDNLGDPF
jgi:hypothetical protein